MLKSAKLPLNRSFQNVWWHVVRVTYWPINFERKAFTPQTEVKTWSACRSVNASTHLNLKSVPVSLAVPAAVHAPISSVHLGQNEQAFWPCTGMSEKEVQLYFKLGFERHFTLQVKQTACSNPVSWWIINTTQLRYSLHQSNSLLLFGELEKSDDNFWWWRPSTTNQPGSRLLTRENRNWFW